ncbi:hypothetical protein [Streptomyces lavendulocolor]|uniref:hypothetical protein n=1 Tax=Streptomyces lavendulocolor TaxID=67316 RepID=UPI0033C67D65
MSAPDAGEAGGSGLVGQILDSLGVQTSVVAGELVAGAIVLLKVIDEAGETRLSVSHSDGLGWIERCGMLRVAEQMESDPASHQRVAEGD